MTYLTYLVCHDLLMENVKKQAPTTQLASQVSAGYSEREKLMSSGGSRVQSIHRYYHRALQVKIRVLARYIVQEPPLSAESGHKALPQFSIVM